MKTVVIVAAALLAMGSIVSAQPAHARGRGPSGGNGSGMSQGGGQSSAIPGLTPNSPGQTGNAGGAGTAHMIVGTVQAFDPGSGQLSLTDGRVFLVPDNLQPAGGSIGGVGSGDRVRIGYFDQGGQRVVSSIVPAPR